MKGPSTALAAFHDYEPEGEDFATAAVGGLSKPQKAIPSKFFYDKRGSVLFDRICELPEYYVTRTEIGLLRAHAGAMAALIGPRCHLVEFGSGSSIKVPILLDALERPAAYTAIDISRQHLLQATAALARTRQGLEVTAVCADYTMPFELPRPKSAGGARPVVFFPGSTIGNFDRQEAVSFLRHTAALLRPHAGAMLVGVDLRKDPTILHAAYNDSQGITAAFNLNLLVRANRELDANFNLAGFRHLAFYDPAHGRIEMHLASVGSQSVRVAGQHFSFRTGETIHTENSCKYSVDGFRALAQQAGFEPVKVWIDDQRLFSMHFLAA
jgi:dimethylhistidine N-methyltransferase